MPYIQLTWVTEAPAAAIMSWGNIVFLASGNTPSQCSNPQLITPSDYTDYLSSISNEYKAYESYKKNFPGTPSNQTFVYWMGGGSGITGLARQESDIKYQLTLPPYESIDNVYVDPTGGSNWQELDRAMSGDWSEVDGISTGFYLTTGVNNAYYDGYINFTGVATDPSATTGAGGPAFDSGGTTYSGAQARAIYAASGGAMRVLSTLGGFGVAQSALKEYDIQFIVPVYDTAGNGTGIENTPAFNDILQALGMAAGNRRMVIGALPSGGKPNVTYGGTSEDYNQFRNYVGQDQNAVIIRADTTRNATTLTGLDNPAAALAGRICASHPHTSLTLDTIDLRLTKTETPNDKIAWDAGKIICVFKNSDLGFSAQQLNYGFTFAGTTPSDRIENVRCKYIVEYNILVDLWRLLSTRSVRISKAGCNKVINTLHGTLNRLLSQGIIDPNEGSNNRIVDIPLLRGTAAEWTAANASRTIPAIVIRWPWKNTVESLIITEFGEII